ncbi:6-phospho-beta-glucosidase [Pseudomonas aeruginosa]|uniref:family 4 glycosyl hydrolase n=1 Tax=Pseudomonas aeruginosa TaxID=287 RepID=UPI0031DBAA14
MKRITIVGGSSPYTVELCEQLRRSRLADWAFELVLHGRTPAALEAVARYARGALVGWKVRTSQALEEALQGSHLVIHQPRYGGSAARARGERLASRLGLPADETLGPAGLLAALEITPHIQRFCSILRQACPDAWVINMSNPASLSTSIFALGGQARCIGVCELPMLTRRRIAEFLDVPPPSLEWSYAGFNHRGFLFDLRVDSRPVLDTLLRRLDASGLMGIPTDVIERLGAVPTKYFALFDSHQALRNDRSRVLEDLRQEVFAELEQAPDRYPASLGRRSMPWYEFAVVPVLEALSGVGQPIVTTANVAGEDGLTWETFCTVGEARVQAAPPQLQVPKPVRPWLERFLEHEQRALETLLRPSAQTIRAALRADPIIPAQKRQAAEREIIRSMEELHEYA